MRDECEPLWPASRAREIQPTSHDRAEPIGANDEREITVRAGEVVVIPSNVPHRALALEDTLDVDVFSPPREDWLAGTDAYLRR